MADSAVAPAASCRKIRRGRFMGFSQKVPTATWNAKSRLTGSKWNADWTHRNPRSALQARPTVASEATSMGERRVHARSPGSRCAQCGLLAFVVTRRDRDTTAARGTYAGTDMIADVRTARKLRNLLR